MERVSVRVPHNEWPPRPHQQKLWGYLQAGGKRAMAVWHRRAGKDEVCLHHTARIDAAGWQTSGHACPSTIRVGNAIWRSQSAHRQERIDEAFPASCEPTSTTLKCSSASRTAAPSQCIGSDPITATVGASSQELSTRSMRWRTQSRGRTTGRWSRKTTAGRRSSLLPEDAICVRHVSNMPSQSPEWFSELLTVEDTGALTDAALAEALKEYTRAVRQ